MKTCLLKAAIESEKHFCSNKVVSSLCAWCMNFLGLKLNVMIWTAVTGWSL